MAEIITEIIVIRRYKFCDEIWGMIKEYIGLYGIDLKIPNIMEKISGNVLYHANLTIFNEFKCPKSGSQRKLFYNHLRLKTAQYKELHDKLEIRKEICELIISKYEKELFKLPEGLKIGETILIYEFEYYDDDRQIGQVSTIGKDKQSFTVNIYEKGKFSHYRIIKKNRKYLRKEIATPQQLKFFNK